MKIVGVKAEKGKPQILVIDKVYNVHESTGKAIIKAKRGKLLTEKKKSK